MGSTPRARRRTRQIIAAALAASTSTLGACQSGRSAAALDANSLLQYQTTPIRLSGKPLSGNGDIRLASRIVAVGNWLVVLDGWRGPILHVFDQQSGDEIGRFGRLAPADSGEDTFGNVGWITDDVEDSHAVWVFDARRKNLVLVHFAVASDSLVGTVAKRIHIPGDAILDPVWINRNRLLTNGLFDKGRFALIDSAGSTSAFVGEVPWDGDSASTFITQQAFQATPAHNDDRTGLALGLRYADRIDVIDANGHLRRSFGGPFGFRPTYHIGRRGAGFDINLRQDARIGYLSVAATDANIFALFSGRTMGTAGGYRAGLGRFIHEFSWDGTLRHVYVLDRDADGVAISQDGTYMFAICPDESGRRLKSEVVAYRLP